MKLALSDVRVDPELQLRDGLDMDRIKAMTEFEEQGGHLPPITVVGESNLLADGHHRLYVAETMGRVDIEAERLDGDKPEAVAIALQRNDISTSLPLTRTQRNQGVKLLLQAGWTQERIATAAGVHHTTIVNIDNALAMRGAIAKRGATGKGGPTPKPVAVLPKEVHEKLNDTTLVRIAELPVEQQQEMAVAVAEAGLSEPRVREAVKAVKAGASVADAVEERTSSGTRWAIPKGPSEVATQAYERLDRFLSQPMTVDGRELDFWEVLDVLVATSDKISTPALGTLIDRLADVSIRCDHYATLLRTDGKLLVTA